MQVSREGCKSIHQCHTYPWGGLSSGSLLWRQLRNICHSGWPGSFSSWMQLHEHCHFRPLPLSLSWPQQVGQPATKDSLASSRQVDPSLTGCNHQRMSHCHKSWNLHDTTSHEARNWCALYLYFCLTQHWGQGRKQVGRVGSRKWQGDCLPITLPLLFPVLFPTLFPFPPPLPVWYFCHFKNMFHKRRHQLHWWAWLCPAAGLFQSWLEPAASGTAPFLQKPDVQLLYCRYITRYSQNIAIFIL